MTFKFLDTETHLIEIHEFEGCCIIRILNCFFVKSFCEVLILAVHICNLSTVFLHEVKYLPQKSVSLM